MSELKVVEGTYREVDWSDLDEFISNHYGFEYECVPDMEWNNDTRNSVYAEGEMDAYDKERLDRWIESKGKEHNYMLNAIMTDLAEKGLIQQGEYLVHVSW